MKRRDFTPVRMTGNRHAFTLEDGRVTSFRIPTAVMLRPMFDALSIVPDEGAVPKTVRDALILEAAGTVIGYLWDDAETCLESNWRTMPSFSEYGANVTDELLTGYAEYAPWSVMDLLNCLSGLTEVLNRALPTDTEVSEAANFTKPEQRVEQNTA